MTEGLDEGEQVVLNPAPFDERLETLSPFNTPFEARWGECTRELSCVPGPEVDSADMRHGHAEGVACERTAGGAGASPAFAAC